MEKKEKRNLKTNRLKTPAHLNDGMNTPVSDKTATPLPVASEAALFKQAENPLGDPHKI